GSDDRTVRVWVLATNKSQTLEGHTNTVMSVAFSPDGLRLASGSEDKTVRVWVLKTGECREVLSLHDAVQSVAWVRRGADTWFAAGIGNSVFAWRVLEKDDSL